MGNQLQTVDQIKVSILDMAIRFGPRLLVAVALRLRCRAASVMLETFRARDINISFPQREVRMLGRAA